MDATCTPAKIKYPTDLILLNEVREKLEKFIDWLHKPLKNIKNIAYCKEKGIRISGPALDRKTKYWQRFSRHGNDLMNPYAMPLKAPLASGNAVTFESNHDKTQRNI